MSPRAKPAPPVEIEPEPEQEKQARVSIPLNADGSIDFSTMRPSTAAKFKAAVAASPDLRESTGGEATPESEKFPREFVPPIWDSIATLTRTVGKMFFAWPADLATAIKFSAEEKQNLTEPTAMMIDKYGSGLKKYAVELNFVNAVANNVGAMAQRAVAEYVAGLQPDPRQTPPGETSPAERPPVNGHDAESIRQL